MTMACGSVDPAAIVGSLLAVADCQARALGDDGWHGLAGSGLFATLLTGLLTLAVAREGYRLLAGGRGAVTEDAVRLLIRFGLVIALCTSWQAWDRLVNRVAMDGPAEIGAAIFPSAGIATSALGARLQNAEDAILTPPEPVAGTAAQGVAGPAAPTSAPLAAASGEAGISRQTAATVLMVTGAGSWIAARFLLALLLAIGPLAIAALLFELSAGLCIGWVRALIGAMLATLVIPLSLSLELQMLAGPVTYAARAGETEIPGLGAIVWSFALVNAALILGVQRVAGGIALPRLSPRGVDAAGVPAASPAIVRGGSATPTTAHLPPPQPTAPSRALAIARAIETRGRAPATSSGRVLTGGATPRQASPATTAASPRTTPIVDAQRGAAAGRRALAGKRLDIR